MKLFTLILILFAGMVLSSCFKDKLDQPAQGLYNEDEISNKKGVQELLIGAYSMLDGWSGTTPWPSYPTAASNWVYGSICGGEAYKGAGDGDQEDIVYIGNFTSNASNFYFDAKWRAVYEGVQRANAVLRIMKKATDMSPADTMQVRGEAIFLRAHFYFEAKKMWNRIPYVDESVNYSAGNYYIVNDTSWAPIENDLKFAMEHLMEVPPSVGQVNKFAAEALLAKAYLFQHKYDQALALLLDLIENGVTSGGMKYGLNTLYSDNFNIEKKNSEESVFACQSSVNDLGGAANGNAGDLLNFPMNGGGPGCCGFFQPSQYLANHFKTDPVTGLPDLYTYNDTDLPSDDGIFSNEDFTPYDGPIDPRLDWTVGRRGIPYLDWGINPGMDWTRFQPYGGPYTPKKSSFYASQTEKYTQYGLFTAINVNLIRYADILLWAAEAEILSSGGDLNKARDFVNQVRARAQNPDGWVHTYVDASDPSKGVTNIPAANYHIGLYTDPWTDPQSALLAVQYERMLELGMEGHRFFDLVRWGIASNTLNAYFQKEKQLRSSLNDGHFTADKNEYFPIPQNQIDLSAGKDGIPKLIQNPNY